MLTVEEIKKCIEEFKPVGFEFLGAHDLMTPTCVIGLKDKGQVSIDAFNKVYYPLFLQRVIEGINELEYKDNSIYEIIAYSDKVIVFDKQEELESFYLQDYTHIDQAKELAIKYVLENL